jgi:WD40 repeat protein
VACFFNENRVVIYDLETGVHKEIEIYWPLKCASSQHFVAITTIEDGLHLFTIDSVLVHIVSDSTEASCVDFHPRNTNVVAIGYDDGTVRMWDISTQVYVSSFKEHISIITDIRFAPDCRLFLSSEDKTASIVRLDAQYQISSSVKLEGHTRCVLVTVPFPFSNNCITCSDDSTVKVWDCENGMCLRTLTEHTHDVSALAMHPKGKYFASASHDRTVVIWSSETFEVLRRIFFPSSVNSLVFDERDTLYAGVYDHGVMSCNGLTGKVGPVIIPGTGSIRSLSLGKSP